MAASLPGLGHRSGRGAHQLPEPCSQSGSAPGSPPLGGGVHLARRSSDDGRRGQHPTERRVPGGGQATRRRQCGEHRAASALSGGGTVVVGMVRAAGGARVAPPGLCGHGVGGPPPNLGRSFSQGRAAQRRSGGALSRSGAQRPTQRKRTRRARTGTHRPSASGGSGIGTHAGDPHGPAGNRGTRGLGGGTGRRAPPPDADQPERSSRRRPGGSSGRARSTSAPQSNPSPAGPDRSTHRQLDNTGARPGIAATPAPPLGAPQPWSPSGAGPCR